MVENLRRHRLYILMFSLTLAVLVGIVYVMRRPEPRTIIITTPAPASTESVGMIQVQVSGAIIQPGVYKITLGSRIADAIDLAGGARPDADLGDINLAGKLSDGDSILVPSLPDRSSSPIQITRIPTQPLTPSSMNLIDINTASVDQLDSLPNIGPVLAQRIVDYRNAQGPFKNIDEIMNVKGIGAAMFEGFKDLISVK